MSSDNTEKDALEICTLLEGMNAADVIGLKMGAECSWASYLIIGTAGSRVQMQGLSSAVKDFLREKGSDPGSGGKKSDESSWRIIDGGDIVVSLMDADARAFYALEERWFEAEVIFGEKNG
jgi:ribosome-associated protein